MAKQPEGELVIDHRASPGIDALTATNLGLPPQYLGEGKLFESATLRCEHCGGVQLKNPLRTRPRASCSRCGGRYICDVCEAATHSPTYTHYTIEQISDMVRSGRWIVAGSTSAPVLIPVDEVNNG